MITEKKPLDISEDEKAVLESLKKVVKIELAELKNQSGLSNKKWDKIIKDLTKNKVTRVENTPDGIFIEVI